ncbi:MAG TPA: hypothetical protein PLA72_08390, partial [Smithellaceae bacterium]|nr:hypothetical protein [Smithellaceae bacterium]
MKEKTPEIFIKLIKNIAQPACIIDENKNVLYVNNCFANKFPLTINKETKKMTADILNSLNFESLENKETADIKQLILSDQHKINLSVYLLNINEDK